MFKIINNTVQVPLTTLLNNEDYKGIKIEKQGTKYAYLNLDQYEDFLSIIQNTKFRKGDKVFWVKQKYSGSRLPSEINSDTINIDRIDVITKVHLSFSSMSQILGDSIRYSTEEVKGDKLGIAYETYLVKVSEYNKLNNTNF